VSSRRDLAFKSEGLRCGAWLFEPDDPAASGCVVLAHGFGCVKRLRLNAFAERFRASGLRALAFDYRHFGDSEGEPRQLLKIDRQLADWRAAVAFARSLPGVDPDRIALWGTSLAGGHVVKVAAADRGVAAVVAQIPFSGGFGVARSTGYVHSLRLTAAGLRDEYRARRGKEPFYIPLYGPPGALAGIAAEGLTERVAALTEGELDNRYTPRIGLRLRTYKPLRQLPRLRCPVLICVAEPFQPPIAAATAPNVTLRSYRVGHFDLYSGPQFERVVAEQAEFLSRHLA